MVNEFDSTNYPQIEPESLVAGDLWAWTRPDLAAIYDTTLYTLSYTANEESAAGETFTLTASGAVYTIEEANTTGKVPGGYRWNAYITRNSDGARVVVASGQWAIANDLSHGAVDSRTHAKKVLQAIEAVIEGTATKQQAAMSIAGRSLSLRTYDELRQMRTDYRAEVESERQAELLKQGKGGTKKILTRFPA